jgi:hypothetical protein
MNTTLRPLGKLREIVLATGLDISYAYDDLIFSENSVFILQFDEEVENRILLYFNYDCYPKEAKILRKRLTIAARIGGFTIMDAVYFPWNKRKVRRKLKFNFDSN